jgi:capsular polysaccharide transport system permease protein
LTVLSRITQADLALAAAISSFALYFVIFWVGSLLVSNYEGAWPPQSITTINLALLAASIIGTAAGFALSGATRLFPGLGKVIGMSTFALRMLSGMFFCIIQVPLQYWPYLTWNPLLHITELIRDAWFESYVSPIASPAYVLECALGLLLFGLAIERFQRRIPST